LTPSRQYYRRSRYGRLHEPKYLLSHDEKASLLIGEIVVPGDDIVGAQPASWHTSSGCIEVLLERIQEAKLSEVLDRLKSPVEFNE
jgi:hypothetical protein